MRDIAASFGLRSQLAAISLIAPTTSVIIYYIKPNIRFHSPTERSTTISLKTHPIIYRAFGDCVLSRIGVNVAESTNRLIPESKCGLRAGRSTMDMIFSLCQLQQKKMMTIYIAFLDLTRVFLLLSRVDCTNCCRRLAAHQLIAENCHFL